MTEREQGIVLLVPLAAILFIPLAGDGGVSSRLGAIFIELLVGLPGVLLLPAALRPVVYPLRGRLSAWVLAPLLLSLAIAFQLLYQVTGLLLPVPEAHQLLVHNSFQAHSSLEQSLLVVSVLGFAPLMEELFFRGFVPWSWARRYGHRGLLLAPALLFALLHLDPWHLPDLLLLGLALGLLRVRLNSLVPAIGLHAFNNLLSLLQLQTGGEALSGWLSLDQAGLPWLALVCALPGALWLLALALGPFGNKASTLSP